MKAGGLKSLLIIFVTAVFIGCLSGPAPVQQPEEGDSVSQGGQVEPQRPKETAVKGDGELVQRLNEYLENGLAKVEQGAISEGINQLVTILAEAQAAGSTSGDIRAIVDTAETELTKIAAGLEMEAGTEWVDANKNQISASSIDVGTENSLNPSVILTYNFGSGKALITGAPIYFEFVQGSGMVFPISLEAH